jgi:hypothetical protein
VSSALRRDEAELGSSDHGAERSPTARLAESFGWPCWGVEAHL